MNNVINQTGQEYAFSTKALLAKLGKMGQPQDDVKQPSSGKSFRLIFDLY